jgi:hypothetical protein
MATSSQAAKPAQAKPAQPTPELDFDSALAALPDMVEDEAPQKVLKLTQFVDDLKQEYPDAKRYDIYLFSDRLQRFDNPWNDNAASIYVKPALVVVAPKAKGAKQVRLSNAPFNAKYETTNWAITFSESAARQIDTSAAVNLLKVVPEQQTYNSNRYYPSRIEKLDKTQQACAQLLMTQLHSSFPTFKKARSQQSRPAERIDDSFLADLMLCA